MSKQKKLKNFKLIWKSKKLDSITGQSTVARAFVFRTRAIIFNYFIIYSFKENEETHKEEIEILVSKIEQAKQEISDLNETLAR